MRKLLLFFLLLSASINAEPTNLAFGHEQIISSGLSGSDIFNFSIAMSKGSDTGFAVWENTNSIGETEIWYSFFDPLSGGWQGPILYDTFFSFEEGIANPEAALNDNGDGYFIYAVNTEPNLIAIQQINSNNQTLGSFITYQSGDDFVFLPDISINDNGHAIAAWFDVSINFISTVAVTSPFENDGPTATLSSSNVSLIIEDDQRPKTSAFILNGIDQGLVVYFDLSQGPNFTVNQSIVHFPNNFGSVTVISDPNVNSDSVDLSMNQNGVGAIVYIDETDEQLVARYSNDGGQNWGPFAFLSEQHLAGVEPSSTSTSLRGEAGFGLTITDTPFGAFTRNGDRYFLSGPLSPNFLNPSNGTASAPTALDAFGNQIILWSDNNTADLLYSFRIHRGNYSRPFTVFSPPIRGFNPQVQATYDGLYVAAYQRFSDGNLASTWTVLLSPGDLRIVSSTENRFPTLSNREVVLTWTGGTALNAPQTPGNVITEYLIFRNGRLIGEVPANADPLFVYHFVDCAATDRAEYSVASFGPYGMSAPRGA